MTGLAVLCGLLTGVGLWLAIGGLRRIERPDRPPLADRVSARLSARGGHRLAIAIGAGFLVAVVTRWPVAAVIVGLFVWAAPGLLGGDKAETQAQDKLEAIAAWTESVRGSLRAYAGIEQALKDSAELARPPIHPHTTALVAALGAGVRLPSALEAFQSDVDHHAADLVSASLRQTSVRQSGNLAGQLGWLATAVRAQVSARRRIETARAESKQSVRLVVVIVAVVAIGLWLFNRPMLAVYDSVGGQLVLGLVGLLWTGATIWLRRLTRIGEPVRVLHRGPTVPDGGPR